MITFFLQLFFSHSHCHAPILSQLVQISRWQNPTAPTRNPEAEMWAPCPRPAPSPARCNRVDGLRPTHSLDTMVWSADGQMLLLLGVLHRKLGCVRSRAPIAAQGVLCRHESDTPWALERRHCRTACDLESYSEAARENHWILVSPTPNLLKAVGGSCPRMGVAGPGKISRNRVLTSLPTSFASCHCLG